MKHFVFFLDWVLNCQFVGHLWAREKGLYRQRGLNVTLVPWQSGATRSIVEELARSRVGAGSSEDNLIALASLEGAGVKAIGATLQDSPLVLMTKPGSGIQMLSDLPGHRVAMYSDGLHVLEAVLDLLAIPRSGVSITSQGWKLDDFVSGRFDAVQGYAITEPALLAARNIEVRLIPLRHDDLHPYAQVIFATEKAIREQPKPLCDFLAATFAGWREAMADQDEAARLVAQYSVEHCDPLQNREILGTMMPSVEGKVGLERFGIFEEGRWEKNLETYARIGLIPRRVKKDEVVEERFLREIYPIRAGRLTRDR
jgi:ABC-type nitrate/sulfonate/bicarbonate transport system substrate-binding protein